MKPKIKVILEMAIEEGVKRGYYRAYKHDPAPSTEFIIEQIESCAMAAIYEYFTFDDSDY